MNDTRARSRACRCARPTASLGGARSGDQDLLQLVGRVASKSPRQGLLAEIEACARGLDYGAQCGLDDLACWGSQAVNRDDATGPVAAACVGNSQTVAGRDPDGLKRSAPVEPCSQMPIELAGRDDRSVAAAHVRSSVAEHVACRASAETSVRQHI